MTTNQSTSLNTNVQLSEDTKMNTNDEKLEPKVNYVVPEAKALKGDFDAIRKRMEKLMLEKEFPMDVFPKTLQSLLIDAKETMNFPVDYLGSAFLFAISVAIGNSYRAIMKEHWKETPILYLAIVGRPGSLKSHPLSFAIKPIHQKDGEHYQKYLIEKQLYSEWERETKKGKKGSELKKAPRWQQHLVSDFTMEALQLVLMVNPRGVGVYSDELASWFKNFNRYTKGSEEQFWLSVWSGKSIRVNRKTSEPLFIPRPFVSVCGTIQPDVLSELAENRTGNGFLDRILFVFPKHEKRKGWKESEMNQDLVNDYYEFIERLLIELPRTEEDNHDPQELHFTPEAYKELLNWQNQMVELCNDLEDDTITSIITKIETYSIRFALCLEVAFYGFHAVPLQNIGMNAVKGAIKLAEYYLSGALKVHKILKSETPVTKLDQQKRRVYEQLPKDFQTNEALEIAEQLNMSERNLKRFLNEDNLFKRLQRGQYQKLY